MQDSTNSGAQGAPANFFSPEFIADPYPYLQRMREVDALCPLPFSSRARGKTVWLVTRWEEALQVLRDHTRFTIEPSRINGSGASRISSQSGFSFGPTMISVDEPEHGRLRALVSKAFTPRYVDSLRPQMEGVANRLLDVVEPRGEMEIVNDFALPLPINIISDMLGIPDGRRRAIRDWSETIVTGRKTGATETRDAETDVCSEFVHGLIAERRRSPQDDLLSRLVQVEKEGDKLDDGELMSTIALFIFAGHETTTKLIASGVLAMLDHPEQLALLKAQPQLIPRAVEELLRLFGPVLTSIPRFATTDTQVSGKQVYRGDTLLVALAAIGRETAQNACPEDLDFTRSHSRHLAFGYGIHACMGARLASLETQIAFSTLLRRMPDMRLNIPREAVSWGGNFNLRGLSTLPVRFGP